MKRKIQFMAMLLIGILLSVNQVWGVDPVQIYLNEGATGTVDGVTATGNTNATAANGNPAPSFGLTSATKNTITLTGINLTGYSSVTMKFDYKRAKSGSNYTSLTISQYDAHDNLLATATRVEGTKDQNYQQSTSININGSCTKITIVCNPAGTTYNTYVDNIVISGVPSAPSTYTVVFKSPLFQLPILKIPASFMLPHPSFYHPSDTREIPERYTVHPVMKNCRMR